MRVFVFLLVSFLFLSFHISAKTTDSIKQSNYIDSEWNDIYLNLDWLISGINYQTCKDSFQNFIGCIQSVQVFADSIKKNLKVIPVNQMESLEPFYKGQILALIETPPLKTLTQKEAFFEFEKLRLDLISKFSDSYRFFKKKSNYDFENMFRFIQKQSHSKLSSYFYIKAASRYLEIASDPHTSIHLESYFSNQQNNQENNYFGLGVVLDKTTQGFIIRKVIKQSGAQEAGLKIGDLITEIAGETVYDKSSEEISDLILGPENSFVEVIILRDQKQIHFKVKRRPIKVPVVDHEIINFKNKSITYISLANFMYEKSCDEVQNIIRLTESKTNGFILDLRDNPGGSVAIEACISGLFLGDHKIITYFEEKNFNSVSYTPFYSTSFYTTQKPLAVLINSNSASASEIVAGALKDYNRAIIVGQTTFGKGTSQNCSSLPDEPRLTLCQTAGLFFLPSGVSNQIVGVKPHLEVFLDGTPSEAELYPLREQQQFLYPLANRSLRKKPHGNWNKLSPPTECLQSLNLKTTYDSATENESYFKDFQLLTALGTVNCL